MAGTSGVIGLLGGMSWGSSALYHRGLNESVQRQFDAHHNARSVTLTLDYEELLRLGSDDRRDAVGDILHNAAVRV
ncbi:hypothetical protein [Neorhizobium sp. DT-125]|uniref:hypothetical protein n=1 Tax=Neorhizobium sp. DT-125 TaxID=3396163 RepID=UPI003F1A3F37